ncbi:DUF86 domain-containing protein [Patescibacteria group bacterium]|nr:DUF86 domain-containing protein [Patescibacteria group bacterium]MBU4000064.1 DUF86 domain-containing protein [Patescibacteria group bacterium]MBU4057245.1 DUF86 domain-containing protein [Patescibacteria group bacterium]MBU4368900.1 DUF86 domain-containing protein [Patescibacteria group bacterium]
MLDKNFIRGKITLIKDYIGEMDEIISKDTLFILKDFKNIRAIEREFQLIVDEMIDVNIHFIKELNLKSPGDFQSTFEILADGKIIPHGFALKIAPVVGLRNKLVHRYEKIDKKFFVEQVAKERNDFIEYIRYINGYLDEID